ncbi:MAG: hypothetical protein NW237_03150 [Cyanobacteriota bacterium]|nr:hypothetical protein [Cyanobacteriota bacterium]
MEHRQQEPAGGEPIGGKIEKTEKTVFLEIDTSLKRLHRHWQELKKSRQTWDFKLTAQAHQAYQAEWQTLSEQWPHQQALLQAAAVQDQAFVQSPDYPVAVEAALRQMGIPLRGEFPHYEFPPFKLTFSLEQQTIRLSLGRKSEQTRIFAHAHLATWVSRHYKRVLEGRFDANRFCQELLAAYQILNPLLMHAPSVTWGHPVPLKEIYRLLTLRQVARQDYPEALFAFDLARLQEQADIHDDSYRLELIPSRQSATGLLLVNSRGQESRVSSLAIYRLQA